MLLVSSSLHLAAATFPLPIIGFAIVNRAITSPSQIHGVE
jgi:hypothetical protein